MDISDDGEMWEQFYNMETLHFHQWVKKAIKQIANKSQKARYEIAKIVYEAYKDKVDIKELKKYEPRK